jgi:hypothetical protein
MMFPTTYSYLQSIDMSQADELDKIAFRFLGDPDAYERASQALRRRFVRGAHIVPGMDRGGRLTRIKRERSGGIYIYSVEGTDGSWSTPDERIWIVAMYGLWQEKNTKHL